MLGVRLYIPHILMIFSVAEAVVVFNKPPSGGETIIVAENSVPHSRLYDLQATDSAGNAPSFSIASSLCESHQNPSIPTFNLNKVDQLLVPAGGLDAESCIQYRIVFQVNAGGSKATSDPLIIKVENVNDLPPRFSKSVYKGEVWKNDKNKTVVSDGIQADDPDKLTESINLSILGAQTTFAIWSNGSVYVNDQSGLSALASSTVLTIQASDGSLTSDGGLTSTATLNITVHDDPCKIRGSTVTSSSCQNGGTCTSNRERYNCTCLDGYIGDHCEKVNYCFSHPCKNNGDCINSESGYICNCSYPFARTEPINQNCTILDYCEPNQCHNSGSCINGTNDKNGYKCLCQENFTGLKCETSWTLHPGNKTKTPNVGLITGICVSSSGACSIVVFVVVYYNKKKKEEINIKSNDTGANERQTSQPKELSELKTVVQQTDGCC